MEDGKRCRYERASRVGKTSDDSSRGVRKSTKYTASFVIFV
jgi:hypothetical protein